MTTRTSKNCVADWRCQQRARLAELFFHGVPDAPLPLADHIRQPLPMPIAMRRLFRAQSVLRTPFPGNRKESLPAPSSNPPRHVPPPVIRLPANTIPVLVGDLHAKVDNLLTLLTEGGVLASLERGIVTLVFLGDAVHPDRIGHLEEMQDSLLMMDLVFTLIGQFPGRVLYLRGNHDSFSADLYKGDVPQGSLWRNTVIGSRGNRYFTAMEAFYQTLPYVAVHPHCVATHAGPPQDNTTLEQLHDLRNHPHLIEQILWNRMQHRFQLPGYREKDIRNFREILKLKQDVPFIVGHTRMDHARTVWFHAGGIEHHHILYSGLPNKVGWIVCLPGVVLHIESPVVWPTNSGARCVAEQSSRLLRCGVA